MRFKTVKEKIGKIDKRLWILIFCVLLYIFGVFFFIGNAIGRAILSTIAYAAYIISSFVGIVFLYMYLKTYFGLDKKQNKDKASIESTCEIEKVEEKKPSKSEINYDLSEVDDGEYGAPYSGV